MYGVLRFLQICLFLAAGMLVLVFLLYNLEKVPLELLPGRFPPQNSDIWMLAIFAACALLGGAGGAVVLLTVQRLRLRKSGRGGEEGARTKEEDVRDGVVDDLRTLFQMGQEVQVQVMDLERKPGQLNLSIKACKSDSGKEALRDSRPLGVIREEQLREKAPRKVESEETLESKERSRSPGSLGEVAQGAADEGSQGAGGRGGVEGAPIKEGDVLEGVVKTIVDYGAFIGLGAVDGLLHISQMSHRHLKHPSEVLKVGDKVRVQVLEVDQDNNRLSLRLKDMGEDPWTDISSRYKPGMRLRGEVIHVVEFGCFVELMPGVEGLVRASEMDWDNMNIVPIDVVQPGDKVEVLIREVNEERRRISLSMKRCQPSPWETFAAEHKVGEKMRGIIRSITDFGVFVTLGQQGKIDGLVQISDLSWDRNKAAALLQGLARGNELETVILSMDPERGRISLGVKQLEEEEALRDYSSLEALREEQLSEKASWKVESEEAPQSEERSRSPGSLGEAAQGAADEGRPGAAGSLLPENLEGSAQDETDEGPQVDAGSLLPGSLGGIAQGATDEDRQVDAGSRPPESAGEVAQSTADEGRQGAAESLFPGSLEGSAQDETDEGPQVDTGSLLPGSLGGIAQGATDEGRQVDAGSYPPGSAGEVAQGAADEGSQGAGGRGGEKGAPIKEGDVIAGVVKKIVDYGAFIGLGAVDGLLHMRQMSHRRLKHPSEVLKEGDEVSVQVLKVDQERNRLSLRLKDLGEDPWTDISSHYQPGMRLRGEVMHVVEFGCFVELMPGVKGLVHVSEMDWANKKIVPINVVQPGDKVEVLILEVNEERRRISLSMKRCQPNPWETFASEHKEGESVRGTIDKTVDFGVFVTLGEHSKIVGLVHVSELSWDPNKAESLLRGFAPGDELETMILSMEPERERISLGVKQLEEDLLGDYYSQHGKHSEVRGTVQQVEPRQILVGLAEGVVGVVPASDASRDVVDDLCTLFQVGQEVQAQVVDFDRKQGQLNLSIKAYEIDSEIEALRDHSSLGALREEQPSAKTPWKMELEEPPQSEERSRPPGSAGEVAQGAADEASPGAIGKNFKPSRWEGGAAPWEDREKPS